MKLCKDCKYVSVQHGISRCTSPKQGRSLVTGGLRYEGECEVLRYPGWLDARLLHMCGKEGRWWGPRSP